MFVYIHILSYYMYLWKCRIIFLMKSVREYKTCPKCGCTRSLYVCTMIYIRVLQLLIYVMWLWLSNELCCIICIYIFYRKMYIQSSPLINEIGCEEKSFLFILNRLFIPNQQLFEYISDLVILKIGAVMVMIVW